MSDMAGRLDAGRLDAGRLFERRLGPSARSLIAYMSEASLKKGSVVFIGWRTTDLYKVD